MPLVGTFGSASSRAYGFTSFSSFFEESLMFFIMSNAVGGISGTLFEDVNFPHPVGNVDGRYTANSSNNTLTITTSGLPEGHGLSANDQVFFEAADVGDLPSPLQPNTTYFVRTAPTSTTLTLSIAPAGSELNLTTNGTDTASRRILKRPGPSDPSLNIEIFHYDKATYPSGLSVTGTTSVGANVDDDFRITCIVVDEDININGGTLQVTSNRRRFGLVVASRKNITVNGTINVPNFNNSNPSLPAPQRSGHPQFRRWRIDGRSPFANGYLRSGATGGAGGGGGFNTFGISTMSVGGGGGSGGSTFGGGVFPRNSIGTRGGGGGAGGRAYPAGDPGRGGGGGGGFVGGAAGPPSNPPSAPPGTAATAGTSILKNLAILYGNNITITGPGPTVRINMKGGNGGNAGFGGLNFSAGGGGGGGGGGVVYIYHSGTYSNSGTINVSGGSGGSGGPTPPSPPGGAGAAGTAGAAGSVVVQTIDGIL